MSCASHGRSCCIVWWWGVARHHLQSLLHDTWPRFHNTVTTAKSHPTLQHYTTYRSDAQGQIFICYYLLIKVFLCLLQFHLCMFISYDNETSIHIYEMFYHFKCAQLSFTNISAKLCTVHDVCVTITTLSWWLALIVSTLQLFHETCFSAAHNNPSQDDFNRLKILNAILTL